MYHGLYMFHDLQIISFTYLLPEVRDKISEKWKDIDSPQTFPWDTFCVLPPKDPFT